jgi:phosphate:Na+ symporter
VELLSRGCNRLSMERAVMLQNRNVLLVSLRETISEFVSAVDPSARPATEDVLVPMLLRLAEALHLLLLQLNDTVTSESADDLALLRTLSGDRSEPGLGPSGHDLLFRATALFERAIWLIRREALLLGDIPAARAAP